MDNDGSAVELGVQFQIDVSGYITGVRFYKYGSNSGTHVGNLWTTTGSRLATATFTGETSSGWQQVSVQRRRSRSRRNTTYVASYHTDSRSLMLRPVGYFEGGLRQVRLCMRWRMASTGPNGVYSLPGPPRSRGPDLRPHANYWVDVLFSGPHCRRHRATDGHVGAQQAGERGRPSRPSATVRSAVFFGFSESMSTRNRTGRRHDRAPGSLRARW